MMTTSASADTSNLPKLDDLHSDAGQLYHLLDMTVEEAMSPNSGDRLAALIWIARDLAERLHDSLERPAIDELSRTVAAREVREARS